MSPFLGYWKRAWKIKGPSRFSPSQRAVPSVLIAIVQFTWAYRNARAKPPLTQMWIALLIIAGVYFCLYVLETTWNLVAIAPVKLDGLSQHELDKLKVSPFEMERLKLVEGKMERLMPQSREAVRKILLHGEINGFLLDKNEIKWDDLQPALNESIVKERMDDRFRIFFISPELKNTLQLYFEQHP
jgi:hypothetical protein